MIAGGSAFNVRAESLRLGDFSPAEVATLLGQHTADTGQEFTPEAVAAVWEHDARPALAGQTRWREEDVFPAARCCACAGGR